MPTFANYRMTTNFQTEIEREYTRPKESSNLFFQIDFLLKSWLESFMSGKQTTEQVKPTFTSWTCNFNRAKEPLADETTMKV